MTFQTSYERRKQRTRAQIDRCNAEGRVRLSVYRANKNIYAQIIDADGKVLLACSSIDKNVLPLVQGEDGKHTKSGMEIATLVGTYVAKKAKEQNIKTVVFDTSGYLYSGRIKALAEAARAEGLQF